MCACRRRPSQWLRLNPGRTVSCHNQFFFFFFFISPPFFRTCCWARASLHGRWSGASHLPCILPLFLHPLLYPGHCKECHWLLHCFPGRRTAGASWPLELSTPISTSSSASLSSVKTPPLPGTPPNCLSDCREHCPVRPVVLSKDVVLNCSS